MMVLDLLKSFWSSLLHTSTYLWARDPKRKPSVEQYPDVISSRTKEDLFPRAKGFLVNDLSVCNGCGDCIKSCTVSAISMDSQMHPDGSVVVDNFRIDLGRCFSCSVCVEICPVSSIKHSSEFELSVADPRGLIIEMQRDRKEMPAFVGKQRDLKKLRSYEARR